MDEQGSPPACQFQKRARVGAPGGPAEHEVDGFGLLEQRDGDLARAETFPDMPDQEIDNGCPAEGPRHFLTEGSEALH